jgi:protein SCO1/2
MLMPSILLELLMSAPEKSEFAGKKTYILLVAVVSIFLGISAFFGTKEQSTDQQTDSIADQVQLQAKLNHQLRERLKEQGTYIFPQPINVTDVPFINEEGQTVGKAENLGKWSFLFFGYTFCPDVCPTTLAVMQQMWVQLSPEMQAQTQVVLVSVDTERDTPDTLKTYMDYFDPSFTAFTGKPASLRSFAAQLNAVYAKVERKNKKGEVDPELVYLMDHSANIAILDPNGNYYGFIKPPFSPKKMLSIVTAIQN